ncbi:hypothetical protein JWG45_17140 [Leptospira sp. 201903070]|uniref:Uncharacterized protein n=1 Tax=Leptospira ainlahdjerensis TaxID=2810033 RepID=A0ABS2UH54_9LEPT|nr:hypothetical protein [Leptospira ainlahdjerensis]MBM9578873.1 hypothetical protein [Leptospira ainlahdjerensis]
MIREFRKDRTLRSDSSKKFRKKWIPFVWILLFLILNSRRISAEPDPTRGAQEEFKLFLKEFQKSPSEFLAVSFRRKHNSVPVSPCIFEESGRFEKVIYLSYNCKEEKFPGFIYLGSQWSSWKNNPERISLGEVLKIGKKVYLEVKPSYDLGVEEHSSWDPKKKPNKETHSEKIRPPKDYKDNFGLQYFLSIAKHPAKRSLNSGKEIFFDSSCPLIFLKKDSDFYWDKATYFSFQASCIPSSPYSFIRIKSDFLGKIRLDDKDTDQIQEGAKYLGKLKIHSIEPDKIVWQDAEIYNE